MTRVLLVRHGLSEWNAVGRWQGWADPPLSPLGEEQAREAARHLPTVDAAVASDLRRAARTAELLAPAAGPVRTMPDLRERDVGEFSGLTTDEIRRRHPGVLEVHPLQPPGAEPVEAMLERVRRGLLALAAEAPGAAVLAVSHGGVIHQLERELGIEAGPVPNLAGRWFDLGGDIRAASDRVVLLAADDEAPVTTPRAL